MNKESHQLGQTSVEYVLMIAVMVTLMMSILTFVRGRMIGDADNCTPASNSIICNFQKSMDFSNKGAIRYFTIRR